MTPWRSGSRITGSSGHPYRRVGRPRRVDRLAVSAPVRLRCLFRTAARRRLTRLLAHLARDPGLRGAPALPGRHPRARDRIRDRRRHRQGRRLHAHSRSASPGGADGRSRPGRGRHAHGPRHPFRLRVDGALGASRRRAAVRHRRSRRAGAVDAHRDPRRGHDHGGRVHRVGHRAHSLRPHLVPLPRDPRRVPVDASYAVHDTEMWWEDWSATCTFEGEWRDPSCVRSSP